MTRSFARFARKPPGKDSARAIAQATLFLVGARSLDAETVESIARRYSLSLKRAEYMLSVQRQRRGNG